MTAPLQVVPYDMTASEPGISSYCRARIIDDPVTSKNLTGAFKEYKVVELMIDRTGLYELRFVGDAGQGTQDLGFRATADILIEAE